MNLRRLSWLLLLCGCGGGTSADQACTDLAAARCNQRQLCSNNSGVPRVYGDLATCLVREKLTCTNSLAAKGTGNSPDLTEQCVAALATESCADYFSGNTPAACVHVGALTDGSSCAYGGQCASSTCDGDKNAACGMCGAAPAAGADCTTSGCARGLVCVATPGSTTMAMSCVAEGAQGAMCSRASPCAAGFTCVGATGMTMGSCMAAATTVGAACDPTARMSGGCAANLGLWCNATSMTCTAIAFAGGGGACGEGSDGNLTDCSGGGLCVGSTFGKMPMLGVCKAPASDGAACDTASGPPCLAPARCVTAAGSTAGTCALLDASKC